MQYIYLAPQRSIDTMSTQRNIIIKPDLKDRVFNVIEKNGTTSTILDRATSIAEAQSMARKFLKK
jgi:hypothetical protein